MRSSGRSGRCRSGERLAVSGRSSMRRSSWAPKRSPLQRRCVLPPEAGRTSWGSSSPRTHRRRACTGRCSLSYSAKAESRAGLVRRVPRRTCDRHDRLGRLDQPRVGRRARVSSRVGALEREQMRAVREIWIVLLGRAARLDRLAVELALVGHARQIGSGELEVRVRSSGSLILALSMGLPVVAADVQHRSRAQRDSEAGWLFRPHDLSSLRTALECAGSDPADARIRGRRAFAIANALEWTAVARDPARLLDQTSGPRS